MDLEEREIILLTVKVIRNLYIDLITAKNISEEEFKKELYQIQNSITNILDKARKENVEIPKGDRLVLYDILKQ